MTAYGGRYNTRTACKDGSLEVLVPSRSPVSVAVEK